MAHLYIINPLSGARMDNLFSTHPDVENRIAQLNRIAETMGSSPPSGGGSGGPWGGATQQAGWTSRDDGPSSFGGPWG